MKEKQMRYCVCDVETTGLPQRVSYDNYYPYTDFDKYTKSRIVSIAWAVYEGHVKITHQYFIIKPSDFQINDRSKATEINKITSDIANSHGVDLKKVFDQFYKDLHSVDTFVAHNLKFDKNIVLAEAAHIGHTDLIAKINIMSEFCTMKNAQDILQIKSKYGRGFKYPSLMETYKFFFDREFPNPHDASSDVNACLACYQQIALKQVNV